MEKVQWRVEFHCHTMYSKDSLTHPQILIDACRAKGLDRVIVTDHNTTRGARHAQELAPEFVIVGEEVMTQQGELLCAFVSEEIPPHLPAKTAITRLREQNAFISVSHPFDVTRSGHWSLPDLLEIVPLVDAIETFNARCYPTRFNQQATAFAKENRLSGTVGSDAHTAWELGRATLLLSPFHSADDLRAVLPHARAHTRSTPLVVRLSSRYAVLRKKLMKNRSSI